MDNQTMPESGGYGGGGYSKKPLWKWILIYIVVGAIVYGLIYYFVMAKKGGYNYNSNTSYTPPTQTQE